MASANPKIIEPVIVRKSSPSGRSDGERIATNAARARERLASESPSDYQAVHVPEPMGPRRLHLYHEHELNELPEPVYLVDGLISLRSFAVMYGPPESFKTFVVFDLANSIATGTSYHGRRVLKGRVVYVLGEGAQSAQLRQRAWRLSRGVEGDIDLDFILEPVSLLNPSAISDLLDEIRNTGPNPVLVVFESLHTSMAGGDENSAGDIGRVVDNARRITRELGATVLVVHHPGRGGDLERGSSALRAAADFIALITRPGMANTVVIGGGPGRDKVKDAAPFKPIVCVLEASSNSLVVSASEAETLSRDERILAVVTAQPGCTLRHVKDRVGGRGEAVSADVRRLLLSGALENRAEGARWALHPGTNARIDDDSTIPR